ncbi:hypothetical protein PR048_031090 [Dryococelus australis]|uniref:Uncharacterized protein n=1 Tax=Dryococelus australis TaxID=614101 RepID=A0ABQ9G4A4_9NEOP|nr:hypothetical protein PR048_031090 [Dryococelus australis]
MEQRRNARARKYPPTCAMIPTYENPGENQPGIDLGSSWWDERTLAAAPRMKKSEAIANVLPPLCGNTGNGCSRISTTGPPVFRIWESCRTMPLVGEFSGGSPVSPTLPFRCCAILTSITLISSQDLTVKSPPNLFTHLLECMHGNVSACRRGRVDGSQYLELHADEVGAITVYGVDGDESIAIRSHHVAILLELDAGHNGATVFCFDLTFDLGSSFEHTMVQPGISVLGHRGRIEGNVSLINSMKHAVVYRRYDASAISLWWWKCCKCCTHSVHAAGSRVGPGGTECTAATHKLVVGLGNEKEEVRAVPEKYWFGLMSNAECCWAKMATHRLDDVGALEEAVFAPRPEGEVALAMGDEKIVVQWVEHSAAQVVVQRLRTTTTHTHTLTHDLPQVEAGGKVPYLTSPTPAEAHDLPSLINHLSPAAHTRTVKKNIVSEQRILRDVPRGSARFVAAPDASETPSGRQPVAALSRRTMRGCTGKPGLVASASGYYFPCRMSSKRRFFIAAEGLARHNCLDVTPPEQPSDVPVRRGRERERDVDRVTRPCKWVNEVWDDEPPPTKAGFAITRQSDKAVPTPTKILDRPIRSTVTTTKSPPLQPDKKPMRVIEVRTEQRRNERHHPARFHHAKIRIAFVGGEQANRSEIVAPTN